ncbi:MAG: PIN domain-containing protein [Burkholderiales bacterium]|nr:PIN domain-containing protein [Burkholderiales bacterium]
MDASVVVDTGPIVAMLDADEANHDWVMSQVQRLRAPLVTCEAVLAEAAFLMSRAGVDSSIVPQLVTRGFVTIAKLFDDDAAQIVRLMARYRNVPMSLTDACLVKLVERTPNATLFTLDSDFSIYRQKGRRLIPLLSP